MNQYFDPFIDDLKSTHGRNLVSVILYGSAAAGDFVPNRSDYNILITLHEIGPKDLRDAHACVREWARLGQPIPVYFTESELKNSADVFPIEFHQMTEAHKVLFGRDVLEGLEISDKFLRLQTEYELRSKLLQLRRHYIPATSSVEGLIKLMTESLSSFSALFRAVLILKGQTPPVTKHEIVAMTVRECGLDGTPFEKLFNIRENNFVEDLTDVGMNDLFGDYLKQIEKVVEDVDSIGK